MNFHNLDILRYDYPLQCIKLTYDAILPQTNVFIGNTKEQVDQLLIMNNNFNERAKQAKLYDLFLIDIKYYQIVSIKCGKTFLKRGNVVFVDFGENEEEITVFNEKYKNYLHFTNIPQITGDLVSIGIGTSELTEDQLIQNFKDLMNQITVPCQDIRNIKSLSLRCDDPKIQLPIYKSILKPEFTFIKEDIPADDYIVKLCKEVKEQNGLN